MAKSPAGEPPAAQTLVEHTWQALQRFCELARLRPDLPAKSCQSALYHLLFWAVFLHDWGKAAQGFQRSLRGKAPVWRYRHEMLSLAFVDWISQGLSDAELTFLSAAIVTHHKDFCELDAYLFPPDEDNDPIADLLNELCEQDRNALYGWLRDCAPAWLEALEADKLGIYMPSIPKMDIALLQFSPQVLRARLRAVHELRRSWEEALDQAEDSLEIIEQLRLGIWARGFLVQADHLASAGTGGLPLPDFDPNQLLVRVGLQPNDLHTHQRQAFCLQGHALLTAPTGSGKTEAALLWAMAQKSPRLFYTLPYQASLNAMYDRLNILFPNRVGLLHGHSALALYQKLMEQQYTPKDAAFTARLLRNRAGLAYYPVRVLTPYQMLKASFQLKGYEALLSDFTNAAFVMDELHVYEPRRLAMILETMRFLAQYYGAQFMVLSATVPPPLAGQLHQILPGLQQVHAGSNLLKRFCRHCLRLCDGDLLEEQNLQQVAHAASEGKQVLVVCNTVRRAQQVYQWLKEHLQDTIPVFLLHSRFCGRDRLAKERAILQYAGLHTSFRQPLVFVATQVVEVSLNLDMDVLFTDLAPLEALLQRFGRVNRLASRPPAPVHVFSNLADEFKRVYQPFAQLEQTLKLLKQETSCSPQGVLVEENRLPDWLAMVYQQQVLQSWQSEYDDSAQQFRQSFLRRLFPFESDLSLADTFDRLFNGCEVLVEDHYEEYMRLKEQGLFFEADCLLVPLSWGVFVSLLGNGKALPADRDIPAIVRLPYDGEFGLNLDGSPKVLEDE
ncbi:MAG: CRISPR-associated helicase Cas3' [Anaerolineales bacterium]